MLDGRARDMLKSYEQLNASDPERVCMPAGGPEADVYSSCNYEPGVHSAAPCLRHRSNAKQLTLQGWTVFGADGRSLIFLKISGIASAFIASMSTRRNDFTIANVELLYFWKWGDLICAS